MKRCGKIKYNHEYRRKIKAGFIGCGGHSYRNVLPTFQYAPVDLIAVCDIDAGRAAHCARTFGAQKFYTDYHAMLEQEELDAVFAVTNYNETGEPKYPEIAVDIMRSGSHAWIEKPPAASAQQIKDMMKVERKTGKFTMVGFKKMFFPAVRELKRIAQRKEFGTPGSIYLKYPQYLPPDDKRKDPKEMQWFLDHVVHPASIIQFLMGPVESVFFRRSRKNGDSVASLTFLTGAVGTLHMTAGRSSTGPLERVEIIGQGANAVVENGVSLTYYRPGSRGPGGYSHGSSYIGTLREAPIHWEPEFSLGELSNKALFLLGYAGEVLEFCDCVLKKRQPGCAGLADALEIMKLYEAFRHPDGEIITLNRRR
jgi:predicted dehydrogenase